jgi:cycloeucalenol cycloisomerase
LSTSAAAAASSSWSAWLLSLLSDNPDKRAAEIFFWKWIGVWLIYFGGIVVTGVYETFTAWSYMKVGLVSVLPPVLIPLLFPSVSGEAHLHWAQRFTTKANIWIFVFAWIGNYFWTHYFYKVLGTGYSMPSHDVNGVPLALYFITHTYFLLYHNAASIALRCIWRALARRNFSIWAARVTVGAVIVVMCYTTAVMEVATIASFPYYTYPDVRAMFVVGSGFYGIYFLGSFPLFLRMDEEARSNAAAPPNDEVASKAAGLFTPIEALRDVLCHCMATTMLLDLWRITIGPSDCSFRTFT